MGCITQGVRWVALTRRWDGLHYPGVRWVALPRGERGRITQKKRWVALPRGWDRLHYPGGEMGYITQGVRWVALPKARDKVLGLQQQQGKLVPKLLLCAAIASSAVTRWLSSTLASWRLRDFSGCLPSSAIVLWMSQMNRCRSATVAVSPLSALRRREQTWTNTHIHTHTHAHTWDKGRKVEVKKVPTSRGLLRLL